MEGIMGYIVVFVGLVIMVSIGTVILGNVTFDCADLSGYHKGDTIANYTNTGGSTGWAKSCFDAQSQGEGAYALLIVVIIIVAAAVVLRAVGLFGS